MFQRKAACLLICLPLLALFPISVNSQLTTAIHSSSRHGFIENKGQIIHQNFQPNPDVLYLLNTTGMNVRLRKGTYVPEYKLVVNKAGDFSAGIATIQCLYVPEFSAHSEGTRM